MKFPTVNKICCCCDLINGGIILGWISAIFSAILLLACAVLIPATVIGYDDAIKDAGMDPTTDASRTAKIVSIVIFCITLLYALINLVASYRMIRGIRNVS